MLRKSFLIFLIITAISVSAAFTQSIYTPKKGSKERAKILDALRSPVEKELNQDIQFSVDNFNVSGNWAFVSGEPLNKSGEKPNLTGTIYEEQAEAGVFDDNFFGLLKKDGGKWRVVTYALGCTDVCYANWWKEYKAPKAIFPYTE